MKIALLQSAVTHVLKTLVANGIGLIVMQILYHKSAKITKDFKSQSISNFLFLNDTIFGVVIAQEMVVDEKRKRTKAKNSGA